MTLKERYEKETVSHSGLSCLALSPRVYRGYKDREEQGSTKGKDLGTAIHCLSLEPERFKEGYLVSTFNIPTGKYANFTKFLYQSCRDLDRFISFGAETPDELMEQMISNARDRSELSLSPDKCWEKLKTDKKLQKYWEYLTEAEGKYQLSLEDKEIADACIASIQMHEAANELIFGYGLSDVYTELEIVWKHSGFKFNMKSIIDRLIVDSYSKTIIIVDLKTTSKNVHKFQEAYERYKYYRQLALYRQAVLWYCKNILKIDLKGWTFKDLIVAVQTKGTNECVVYEPHSDDLLKGTNENYVLLKRMEWHFENDKWLYPKEYYDNNGIITLKIDEQKNI